MILTTLFFVSLAVLTFIFALVFLVGPLSGDVYPLSFIYGRIRAIAKAFDLPNSAQQTLSLKEPAKVKLLASHECLVDLAILMPIPILWSGAWLYLYFSNQLFMLESVVNLLPYAEHVILICLVMAMVFQYKKFLYLRRTLQVILVALSWDEDVCSKAPSSRWRASYQKQLLASRSPENIKRQSGLIEGVK